MSNSETANIPTFNNLELQDSFTAFSEVMDAYNKRMDEISTDIKRLEEYLRRVNLKTKVQYHFEPKIRFNDTKYKPRPTLRLSFDIGGEGESEWLSCNRQNRPGKAISEGVAWDEDSSGRFRLFYERSEAEGCYDSGKKEFMPDMTTESFERKPLIETKMEVRARLATQLHEFVDHLALELGKRDEFLKEFECFVKGVRSEPVKVPRGIDCRTLARNGEFVPLENSTLARPAPPTKFQKFRNWLAERSEEPSQEFPYGLVNILLILAISLLLFG